MRLPRGKERIFPSRDNFSMFKKRKETGVAGMEGTRSTVKRMRLEIMGYGQYHGKPMGHTHMVLEFNLSQMESHWKF